jgi:DNA-directed RNA polymerase subunit RPC12/RpoP
MCNNCQALMINGVYCHETGCPDSHLDVNGKVECQECGYKFIPDYKGQKLCDGCNVVNND